MPVIWLIVGMTIVTMLGTRGWGLSDDGWPRETFYMIGAVIGMVCLLFETEPLKYRIWYLLPYGLVIWGVPGAIQWHLGSTSVTLNILVIVIGLAGALPGGILYMILSSIFSGKIENEFHQQNPDVYMRRQLLLSRMDPESIKSLRELKAGIEKVTNSDVKQEAAASAIMDFVNANAAGREDAERFFYMYDAVNKRDLIQDLVVMHGRNNADGPLRHLISIGFIDDAYPFEPRLQLVKNSPVPESGPDTTP